MVSEEGTTALTNYHIVALVWATYSYIINKKKNPKELGGSDKAQLIS